MSALEIANQIRDYNKKLLTMDTEHIRKYHYISRSIREELMWAREELRFWLRRMENHKRGNPF